MLWQKTLQSNSSEVGSWLLGSRKKDRELAASPRGLWQEMRSNKMESSVGETFRRWSGKVEGFERGKAGSDLRFKRNILDAVWRSLKRSKEKLGRS